jgi:hypothetical protein
MAKIVYEIVQHDGGWAYRVGKVVSEPFPTREAAHLAAQQAADRQRGGVSQHDIEFEDSSYHWHTERSGSGPDTDVDDPAEKPKKK